MFTALNRLGWEDWLVEVTPDAIVAVVDKGEIAPSLVDSGACECCPLTSTPFKVAPSKGVCMGVATTVFAGDNTSLVPC